MTEKHPNRNFADYRLNDPAVYKKWYEHEHPDPARMVISAVGMIDPSDGRYQSDKTLLQTDLRADSRSQLVAKALGLLSLYDQTMQ